MNTKLLGATSFDKVVKDTESDLFPPSVNWEVMSFSNHSLFRKFFTVSQTGIWPSTFLEHICLFFLVIYGRHFVKKKHYMAAENWTQNCCLRTVEQFKTCSFLWTRVHEASVNTPPFMNSTLQREVFMNIPTFQSFTPIPKK